MLPSHPSCAPRFLVAVSHPLPHHIDACHHRVGRKDPNDPFNDEYDDPVEPISEMEDEAEAGDGEEKEEMAKRNKEKEKEIEALAKVVEVRAAVELLKPRLKVPPAMP